MSQYPLSQYPLSCEFNDRTRRVSDKTRGITILLALLFGSLGVHRFYLNRPGSGVLYFVFCWTLIPLVFSLVEVLLLLIMSNREFDYRYNMQA